MYLETAERIAGSGTGSGKKGVRSGSSFFLHMRPRSYRRDAVSFGNTLYLGFLAVFFMVLEFVTGIVLMVYYVPTPEGAYGSVVRLITEVPFGWFMRDLHRLGGELMIIAAVCHMIRVFISDSYRGKAAFTWFTGMMLLLCTLLLAFSGYLLPWDQLAYWAVTIGTGLSETIPVIGGKIAAMFRGGPEFGQDGLLRFYLLHIIVVPGGMMMFMAIHYYRISRLHGISLPLSGENSERPRTGSRVPLLLEMAVQELILALLILFLLIIAVVAFYDAPLGYHADPRHTPSATTAPWFFLWLQGALKMGDSFVMGICFPAGLLALFTLYPWFGSRRKRKPVSKRIPAMIGLTLLGAMFGGLTLAGLPEFGFHEDPVAAVLRGFIPEEKKSVFHEIGYNELTPGIYETHTAYGTATFPESVKHLIAGFAEELQQMQGETVQDPRGVLVIEEWQADLKKVTVRINWRTGNNDGTSHSLQGVAYVHRATAGNGIKMEPL